MAFANVTDIVATTIENRSKKVADNVTKNNALLAQLKKGGRVKTVSGGSKIYQELSFQANGNAGWFSGYDLLPTAAQDVISAAEYQLAQAACPVTISGLELLQNNDKEAVIDLLESRLTVAEASMANLLAQGVYSDGTGSGGKQVTGLDAAVPATVTASQTATYGGISRTTWAFWRSYCSSAGLVAVTSSNVQGYLNTAWSNLVRGTDRPDLIIMDPVWWNAFTGSLQLLQRFTSSDSATLGFPTVKFFDADVVLDGGIGGFATAKHCYMLNTKHLFFRPHKDRNMVPLAPNKRYAINQDAEVQIIGWAGQVTCDGAQFQGRLISL